ncbi:hypothetical protein KJY78_04980 [Canibacter sp. lx-45]|uniref:hypothetical protein n=1 Tax=Canibacter zhuwentaonis TaxID=2837491 RepID=UPI001BDD4BE0|nr:hypothetical protein [Canibacter zhuwentaonis]
MNEFKTKYKAPYNLQGKKVQTPIIDFTTIGAKDDATALDNMLKALTFIDKGNEYRQAGDKNFPVSAALMVTDQLMAISQINANYSRTYMFGHSGNWGFLRDFGTASENLAWSDDAYDGWYAAEKKLYDKHGKVGYDRNISEKYGTWQVNTTGHYESLMKPDFKYTGFGYRSGQIVTQQLFTTRPDMEQTYTVAEYRNRLSSYMQNLREQIANGDPALKTVLQAAVVEVAQAQKNLASTEAALEDLRNSKVDPDKARAEMEKAKVIYEAAVAERKAAEAEQRKQQAAHTAASQAVSSAQTALAPLQKVKTEADAEVAVAEEVLQAATEKRDEKQRGFDAVTAIKQDPQKALEKAQAAIEAAQAALTAAQKVQAAAEATARMLADQQDAARKVVDGAAATVTEKTAAHGQALAAADAAARVAKQAADVLQPLQEAQAALDAALISKAVIERTLAEATVALEAADNTVATLTIEQQKAEMALAAATAYLANAQALPAVRAWLDDPAGYTLPDFLLSAYSEALKTAAVVQDATAQLAAATTPEYLEAKRKLAAAEAELAQARAGLERAQAVLDELKARAGSDAADKKGDQRKTLPHTGGADLTAIFVAASGITLVGGVVAASRRRENS